ncbi:hypothetical protein pdul_cds_869 [Pandoravirus dulcis]|uniref:Uncharacterized protein n=1 Tax=Pandoravirus dulcis TaxID=1349409 RepID=S4VYF1_9VIRU|nr:hypothetical protein pdul_cds_869 [Pandoravirus dulcis]AGO83091.2 hypothetical protein pdul_cds_869 [Pandoravirus dulcis]
MRSTNNAAGPPENTDPDHGSAACADETALRTKMSFEEPAGTAGWCARLAKVDAALDERDTALDKMEAALAEMEAALDEREAAFNKQDALLGDLDRRLCAVESALFPKPKNKHRDM